MNIGCIIAARNEEHCIHIPISSIKEYVNTIYVFDDHSTDETARIASALGANVLKNTVNARNKGFSEVFNSAISRVKENWILILDADEILDVPHLLHYLQRFQGVDAWALPRRKWYNYSQKQRIEFEAYPDWQPRFFKNIPENRFSGELHKTFLGKLSKAYRGPHIEHLQRELSSDLKDEYRKELYQHLADIQLVHIERGNRKVIG